MIGIELKLKCGKDASLEVMQLNDGRIHVRLVGAVEIGGGGSASVPITAEQAGLMARTLDAAACVQCAKQRESGEGS